MPQTREETGGGANLFVSERGARDEEERESLEPGRRGSANDEDRVAQRDPRTNIIVRWIVQKAPRAPTV